MATFYTGVDKERYDAGNKFVPMDWALLDYKAPTTNVVEDQVTTSYGIPNTNAFINSGGGTGGTGGNAFGYGTAINPVAYGQYGAPGYKGGLSGDVQQYGVGRQFEDPSASPTGETYSYKKEVPGWMRAAAGFIPFGNTAVNFVQNKMNQNRGTLSGYRMGGLDEIEKGAYNQLAGSELLFEGPSGLKTLTGKNFGAKGYFEGQEELAKGFGFDQMTDAQIQEAIDEEGKRHSKIHKGNKGFKYKQMLEAAKMRNYNEEIKQKEIDDYNLLQAQKTNPEILSPHNPLIGKIDHTGSGGDVHSAVTRAPGSKVEGAPTHSTRDDLMASGGRVGLNLGGLASMLGREGFADGGLDWDEGGDTPMPGGGHGSGHEDAVAAMGGDNQNNTVVVPKTNYIDIEPHLLREDPYIDLSLMDPLEIAKLQASIGYRDILDNDDISVKGDFTTNIGPVDTNTQFTETGIGDTDINYGNFSTTIDPNKNIKNIGYNSSYNGINYGVNYADGNTMFNVGTTFKNGGLARLL